MNPIALIGRADCWKQDLCEFKKLTDVFDVMTIGLDCPYAGDIQYFVTYHYKDIPEYIARRKSVEANIDFLVIGHKNRLGVDIVQPHKEPSGSSSMMGAIAAINLGYKKIILCGCPLEGMGVNGLSYNQFQKGWIARLREVEDYVRSMSGWTQKFLGSPTIEWLK